MLKFVSSLFGGAKEDRVVEIPAFRKKLVAQPGKTILETALSAGVPYPHNCTVGTCGACKTRLIQGRVKAVSDFGYALSRQELEAGYILACQAMPMPGLTVVDVPLPGATLPTAQQVTGRILARSFLTHDICQVEVELSEPIQFLAGQYASIKAPMFERARHYSFASAPQHEGTSQVSFAIRKIFGGAFTEALFSGQLDEVELSISAPHGEFYRRTGDGLMLCIAGGSGLAPILSLLDDMRMSRVARPCVLLYGARTQKDLYALEKIASIEQSWSEKFKFLPVLSNEPEDSDWTGARGLVTAHIKSTLMDHNPAQAQAYMCGPPPMIDSAIGELLKNGMNLSGIYYDKFTDGADKEVKTLCAAE